MNLIYRNARRKCLRIPASLYSSVSCNFVKIIFHQDNIPAHKSVLAMGKLRDMHYELLEHPPCSPDLAPYDFHLFPKLKHFLAGQHFFFESRADCSCTGVFCRSYEEPLQRRDNGAGASLE